MNKQRIAIIILAALGISATFMPWVKVPLLGSINGTKGDGWITLAFFVVPLIISLLKDKTKALKGGLLYGAIIPSIIASTIGILKIIDLNSMMSKLGDNPFSKALGASVSIEYGLYLIIIAGFALPVVALLMKDKKVVSE